MKLETRVGSATDLFTVHKRPANKKKQDSNSLTGQCLIDIAKNLSIGYPTLTLETIDVV
jgi:hypothetical protein